MATVKSKEQVQELLKSKAKGGRKKPIRFDAEITKLKKGEGLFISDAEWAPMKTAIPSYYYQKYKGKKVVSISKDTEKGKPGYTLVKL